MVPTVGFPELHEEIALFELGAYDDPGGPQHVEEESIGWQARRGPDEQEHAQVEECAMAKAHGGPKSRKYAKRTSEPPPVPTVRNRAVVRTFSLKDNG